MGRLSLEKQILRELMSRNCTLDELTDLFGDSKKYCDNLIDLKMISGLDSEIFKIYCPVGAGKNKKFLTKESSLLEEIFIIFDKRRNSQRIEKSYVRYDDSKGRGSPESWKKAAQSLLSSTIDQSKYLKILGLKEKPETLKELRTKYLSLIKKEHPDVGGDSNKAEKIIEAYNLLKKLY